MCKVVKLTPHLRFAAYPSRNFSVWNHSRISFLWGLVKQKSTRGLDHCPEPCFCTMLRCSIAKSCLIKSSFDIIFCLIWNVKASVKNGLCNIFLVCMTSMLWGTSSLWKYESFHRPGMWVQLCSTPYLSNPSPSSRGIRASNCARISSLVNCGVL
jgi:hypothetical protein